MTQQEQTTREENIAYWRAHLKEVGPANALSYLLKTNENEKVEVAESGYDLLGFGGLPICVSLHLSALNDANEMLGRFSQQPFEEAIFERHMVIFAAALGEHVLRNYLRHFLIALWGWCNELDEMIDILIEMWNRRRSMPIEYDQEYLDSWWDDFPPDSGCSNKVVQ